MLRYNTIKWILYFYKYFIGHQTVDSYFCCNDYITAASTADGTLHAIKVLRVGTVKRERRRRYSVSGVSSVEMLTEYDTDPAESVLQGQIPAMVVGNRLNYLKYFCGDEYRLALSSRLKFYSEFYMKKSKSFHTKLNKQLK